MRNDAEFDDRLAAALKTRPTIDQAKGILVATRCETPEAAFAELKYVSELHRIKVSALAAALVDLAAGRELEDDQLARVIQKEWGGVLPRC